MDNEIHIAGLLVHAAEGRSNLVAQHLQDWPGVEIGAVSDDGKMVVVCEGGSGQEIMNLIDRMRELPEVVNVVLVYQHAEPTGEMEKEIGDGHH